MLNQQITESAQRITVGNLVARIYATEVGIGTTVYDLCHRSFVRQVEEVYDATEEDWEIRLSDYLQRHDSVRCYLSPDEKTVHALDKATKKLLFSYELEDSWTPPTEQ